MSVADDSAQFDERAKKLTATKFVRWAKLFLKSFGETSFPVETIRSVPDGTRVYCVGDIHGRDDLLELMAERVKADIEDRSVSDVVTVFLGDYVDRGFGSMQVLEGLSRGKWPTPMVTLAGNHEDFLMAFLDDAATLGFWRGQGGLATLYSYEVDVGPAMVGRDFAAVQAAFTARFPKHHRDFL